MRRLDERNYQTTWEDLEPWLQQLYEDHNVSVTITVSIPMGNGSLTPAVVVDAVQHRWPEHDRQVKRDWRPVRLRAVGLVEREALQMLSMLLLELENDKAAAERQQTLWPADA